MSINFKEIKKNAWVANSGSVDLEDLEIIEKIKTRAELIGITYEELLSDIKRSKYFKCVFCKDPNRQNIYEGAELGFLKSLYLIEDAIKLDPSGENAKHVNNHILSSGECSRRTTRKGNKSKSIDFKFKILPYKNRLEKITCYAMHKYTESSGGAQDNQYQDLRIFLENAPLDREECFIALADGNYYNRKIEQLKKEFDIPSKRRVFTSNELETVILNGEII